MHEEVEIVFEGAPSSVVMIDDFQVLDDTDYGYDDYGGGMALDVSYILPSVKRLGLTGFYPAAAGKHKSGAKRGSIVLAKELEVVARLRTLSALREISWSTDDRKSPMLSSSLASVRNRKGALASV